MYNVWLILAVVVCSNGYAANWQCVARDKENKAWSANSSYQQMAINNAYDACKQMSRLPESCSVAQGACQSHDTGGTTMSSSFIRCTALDELGNAWKSNGYRQPDDAVLAAKAYCKDKSPLPETCYSYPILCSVTAG